MKKIFSLAVVVSALCLSCGIASAAPVNNANTVNNVKRPVATLVKYTAEQQTCINNERKTQQASVKTATDAFNAATADALKAKQEAFKTATDAFNAATATALKAKQEAFTTAQSLKDPAERMAAMKKANDAYNNSSSVKAAKTPYMDALKAANDTYNNDASVQKNKPVYMDALKAARATNVIKDCTGTEGKSFWKSAGDLFSNSTSALIKAFKKSTSALINAFIFVK